MLPYVKIHPFEEEEEEENSRHAPNFYGSCMQIYIEISWVVAEHPLVVDSMTRNTILMYEILLNGNYARK